MLHKILYSLLIALISFNSHSKDYAYSGTIGKYPVFLILKIEQDAVTGTYCYQKNLVNIYFGGKLKNDEITLETTNPNNYVVPDERFDPEHFRLKWAPDNITGTWQMGKKTLSVKLQKPDENKVHCARIENNPFLKKQGYDDYDQLKIGQFKLKEVDSLHTEKNVKVRTFEEINTKTKLYRIDSGLSKSTQQTANQYLEFIQVGLFLDFLNCAAESGNPPNALYGSDFYDLTVSENLLSIACFHYFDCGYPHPGEYNYGISFNLKTLQEIKPETYLKFGVEEQFNEKVVQYFKKEYPGYMSGDDDEAMDCDFGDKSLWTTHCQFVFTPDGLKLLPSFSHYRAPCMGPEWTVIPYSELRELIKPEYWALLNELKP